MTYTQQLKDYEEAVMAKRLEEMSDSEIDDILERRTRLRSRRVQDPDNRSKDQEAGGPGGHYFKFGRRFETSLRVQSGRFSENVFFLWH